MSKSTIARPGFSRSRRKLSLPWYSRWCTEEDPVNPSATLFPSTATSTLLFLTADPSSISKLTSRAAGFASYSLTTPAPPTSDALRQWSPLHATIALLQKRFMQGRFNQLEDPGLRLALARYYVRDLTVLALYSDAFIVSGTSQTGQLACLIAGTSPFFRALVRVKPDTPHCRYLGEDAVVGPRGINGRGLGGRVRSFDEPWRPSEKESTLWSTSR